MGNEYAGIGTYLYEDGTIEIADRTAGRRALFNRDRTRASLRVPNQKERQVSCQEALAALGVEMPPGGVPCPEDVEFPEDLGTLIEQRKRAGEVRYAVRECLKNEGHARLMRLAGGGGGVA